MHSSFRFSHADERRGGKNHLFLMLSKHKYANGHHDYMCTSPGNAARSKMRGESESVSHFYWILPASSE